MRPALIKYVVLSFLFVIAFLVPFRNALSDEEMWPYPYVAASIDGRFYFKMIPVKEITNEIDGHGTVYEVKEKGPDKQLWSTTGWYAFKVYLSCDGKYLVRLGNWPRGHNVSEKDLAVAFYKEGKFLNSYSTKKLIKDETKVQHSVSHYSFFKGNPGFDGPCGDLFKLITIDGLDYSFDIRSGKITEVHEIK